MKFLQLVTLIPVVVLCTNFHSTDSQGVGEPLFLTPYIREGRIEEAREAARVRSDITLGVTSYTGFITVNETYGSNMFFWFIPAAYEYETAPVMFWVEGGGGFTGLFEVFFGNGPFTVDTDANIHLDSGSWSLTHSMLYLDNPVGSGFSFTQSMDAFPTNGLETAPDMYEFLTQFFKLFPELQKNDFYVGGISFSGGVMSPGLVHHIHTQNQLEPEVKINLKGAVLCAPAGINIVLQSNWGEFFYSVGLIDDYWREKFAEKYAEYLAALEADQWKLAQNISNQMFVNADSLFVQASGYDQRSFYNFYYDQATEGDADFVPFLEKEEVRRALHVGSVPFDYVNMTANQKLASNDKLTMIPIFEDLLTWTTTYQYKLLIAVGQFDMIVYPHGVNDAIRNLTWPGQQEFNSMARKVWRGPDGHVAGYWKTLGNFTQIFIRNTGHDMNVESPEWTYDMVYRFTRGLEYPS